MSSDTIDLAAVEQQDRRQIASPTQARIDLAELINAAHAACEASVREAITHARDCGALLIEAKAQLKHGQWLPWLRENCVVKERQARAYMRVAENWDRLSGATEGTLTIKRALTYLADPKPKSAPGADLIGEWLRSEWAPDVHQRYPHVYSLLLDAAGWDLVRIANAVGLDTEEIELFLAPVPRVSFSSQSIQFTLGHGKDAEYQSAVEHHFHRLRAGAFEMAAEIADRAGVFELSVSEQMRRSAQSHRRRQEKLLSSVVWNDESKVEWAMVLSLAVNDARRSIFRNQPDPGVDFTLAFVTEMRQTVIAILQMDGELRDSTEVLIAEIQELIEVAPECMKYRSTQ